MKREYMLDDVIAAISTPIGTGGSGIVRMSGAGCIALADSIFIGKKKLTEKATHTLSYGKITDGAGGEIIDEVLVSVMKAPHTYTKEDIVEINCHGGSLVTRRVLEAVLKTGARIAQPGEFTKRSFLNGRIDLTQAEAVIDLIESKTELSRQAAVNQLEGRLKTAVREMREEILDMIASIEAVIDYPDYDVEEETYGTMEQGAKKLLARMEKLLEGADRGKIIREGLQTVIVGKPNVGKSSLLNWLLEEDRAIVTDIPGTTRDTVEEYLNIDGIPIKIVDTAGIRETGDVVEKMGVEKSKAYAETADLVIMMLDGSRPLEEEDKEILSFIRGKKTIDALLAALKNMFLDGHTATAEDAMLGNTRHKDALYRAKEAMEHCMETITMRMPEDFISMDLQDANRALGEITGDTSDEEIIDRIFTKFCLGK